MESVEIDWDDRSPVIEVSGQELVPVIDDGGEIVYDSATILRYLEEKHPEPPLFPADPARRAEMDIFIDWFNEVWKRDPNGIDDELAGDADPAAIAAMSKRMADSLDRFEAMLDGREYLMGDEVSAADFAAFPFLKYATIPMSPDDPERFHKVLDDHLQPGQQHSGLKTWVERIDALPRV